MANETAKDPVGGGTRTSVGRDLAGRGPDILLRGVLRVAFWSAVALLALGVVLASCEALGRGLAAYAGDGGDGSKVTVAAAKEPTSELRAELYAQALDTEGYDVERVYGLGGWRATKDAFVRSGGAFVFPAQASGPEPDDVDLPGAVMLDPTAREIGDTHPAPVAGDDWAASNPAAVAALDRTTRALKESEFAILVEAVEDGVPVAGAVYAWRRENGLPPAPDVRPPETIEREGKKT